MMRTGIVGAALAVLRVAAMLAMVVVTVAPAAALEGGGRPTTVILVRHAEKGPTPADDPGLTDEGRARAERLARVVPRAGVAGIVTSQYARTKQTAEPVGKALGVTPVAVALQTDPATKRLTAASRGALVDAVMKHAGGVVLVVGHSNTTQELIEALGGGADHVVDEKEFDDLFVVTVTGPGAASVVRLKY